MNLCKNEQLQVTNELSNMSIIFALTERQVSEICEVPEKCEMPENVQVSKYCLVSKKCHQMLSIVVLGLISCIICFVVFSSELVIVFTLHK